MGSAQGRWGPYVNYVTTGAAGVASVNITCYEGAYDTAYIYDAAGNVIGSAACAGTASVPIAQTITSSEALASGDTVQANEYYIANSPPNVAYWPSLTTVFFIS